MSIIYVVTNGAWEQYTSIFTTYAEALSYKKHMELTARVILTIIPYEKDDTNLKIFER
jgi:hypothetical protein